MPVCEPELADYQAVGIFGLCQIRINPLRVEIQGVDVIHRKLALDARRILAHGKIDSGSELLPVRPELHYAGEGVDVDRERLEGHFIGTGLDELLLQILPGLVGPAPGIAAALVSGAAEFLYHAFVMREVLRLHLHGAQDSQN